MGWGSAGFVKVSTDEYFGGRRLQVLDRLGSNREGGKDYFPYGEERSATANPADKFGTYHRDATGLDYADQRYYVPSAARFATKDPAGDGSNWFAYTQDPVNSNDPSGLAVFLIGGTGEDASTVRWGQPGTPQFNWIVRNFGEEPQAIYWGGGVVTWTREGWTKTVHEAPAYAANNSANGERITVFAFSHGGNIAYEYTNRPDAVFIDILVTLGTPQIPSIHMINNRNVGTFLNIYSSNDGTQVVGGPLWRMAPYALASYYIAAFFATGPIGGVITAALGLANYLGRQAFEFGPIFRTAGRTNPCAINIGISRAPGVGTVQHSDMTTTAVWDEMLAWMGRAGYGGPSSWTNLTSNYCRGGGGGSSAIGGTGGGLLMVGPED